MKIGATQNRMRVAVTLFLFCASVACSDRRNDAAAIATEEASPVLPDSPAESLGARLEPNQVPADLHDLIPLAEKWGIGDDVERGRFQAAASSQEKEALRKALAGRNKRITQWLDSFAADDAMPPEAAAFMYMQQGLDEMGMWVE